MKQIFGKVVPEVVPALVITNAVFVFFGVYTWKTYQLEKNELASKLNLQVSSQQIEIDKLKERIDSLSGQASRLLVGLSNNEQKTGQFTQKIGQINEQVDNLQKLSAMDPELLKKYSKIYFLNENYVPVSLTKIDQKYLNDTSKNVQVHSSMYPFLESMIESSLRDGVNIQVQSGFRSFGAQATLKSTYKVTYGAGTANSFSADQGYSEHQLGTTLDFTNPKIGSTFAGFDKSSEYEWLTNNAYKFGFVISYPKENNFYVYEPWHWRFVGVELAKLIHSKNTYFYAIDQREIDNYLGKMFD